MTRKRGWLTPEGAGRTHGTCPRCERKVRLAIATGMVLPHIQPVMPEVRCPGSGLAPKESRRSE